MTPPTRRTFPFSIRARFRKSVTLMAITSLNDKTISPVVASPLFNRWVQSLFIKTEHREESLSTLLSGGILLRSASVMFIRANCCLKNSPVPEAHLLPEKLVTIFGFGQSYKRPDFHRPWIPTHERNNLSAGGILQCK